MRVVIGEDEALLREGLVLLLEGAGYEVAAVADNAVDLVSHASRHRPDLVLTDIRMPPEHTEDGLRAAIAIRAAHPATAVLVLSQYVHRQYAQELLADRPAGVGYLLKQRVADVAGFCRDLDIVAGGGTVLDPEVVSAMLSRARSGHDALTRLTPRQSDVIELVAQGRTNSGIARRLGISEKAVVQHVSRIYDLLGLSITDDDHRRVLAVIRYLTS
ncbi:response regulator [Pseudonocardia benzenivorans]|uniref:Two component transcriptional regulator, LuxR family n=2 Tax=Pseudonocardia TaxID=1847 RepID=F4CS03_PSEUX|nr:response regulator transcription factor [Pseudonocardia dioxanivorans]AEA28447.1 two component transcriptional regulator, LuxR family [Pseudonocardia dioxanivorans CB1190]